MVPLSMARISCFGMRIPGDLTVHGKIIRLVASGTKEWKTKYQTP